MLFLFLWARRVILAISTGSRHRATSPQLIAGRQETEASLPGAARIVREAFGARATKPKPSWKLGTGLTLRRVWHEAYPQKCLKSSLGWEPKWQDSRRQPPWKLPGASESQMPEPEATTSKQQLTPRSKPGLLLRTVIQITRTCKSSKSNDI